MGTSPSMRREWIEILRYARLSVSRSLSPSMRREWIEIFSHLMCRTSSKVSLHAEGVD